ncbi:hypothetical protein ACGFWF_16275 [Streptomyces sp. NPDC048581]|uniref:hypothetical protein n=1 Tax=Streptomyces sp. NPDC048581 TaxID=3365572 RepID=UPI003720CCE0
MKHSDNPADRGRVAAGAGSVAVDVMSAKFALRPGAVGQGRASRSEATDGVTKAVVDARRKPDGSGPWAT